MPNLDPVHDHAGSAADPDFTITEDDRIGALIEAHSELTASLLRTLGHLTTAVEGMSRAVESLAARLDPPALTVNELADGAGLVPVVARSTASVDHGLAVASVMTLHGVKTAALLLCDRIRENLSDVETKIEGDEAKATVRMPGALCTIYTSGKATTGGSDHNLRDNLRAILRAEGFDVRC